MSKVALVADIHFGVSGKTRDIKWAADVVRMYCHKHAINTVVILGDLSHDRKSVDMETYCEMHSFFTECRELGQNWYTFVGNHDMYLKHSWSVNSARPLSGIINVIDGVKVLEMDGRRHWILPFIHFENSYMAALRKLEERYEDGDVLFTHIGVRGSILNTCFLLKDWSYVNFEDSKFRKIYTGHFHSHQTVGGTVVYPGSLIPFKYDEGDIPHGFLLYDTETADYEFVDVWEEAKKLCPGDKPAPKFMTVLDEQLASLVPDDVMGNSVRVALSRDYQRDELREMRSMLTDLGAKTIATLRPPAEKVTKLSIQVSQSAQSFGLFKRWYESDNPKDIQRSLVLKLDEEVRREGDDRYESMDREEY